MRYLVISDIHANLEALEATLHAGQECDRVLVLGDLVGYGADPNAVVERVRALPSTTVIRGNHDKVGSGVDTVEGFNHLARQAIAWTTATLTEEHRDWLAALPRGPLIVDDVIEICHGSPIDEDAYIFDDLDATRALRAARTRLCLVGHTHVPAAFQLLDRTLRVLGPLRGSSVQLVFEGEGQYLVNCGAVGQPRDGNPQAAFGVLDTSTQTLTIRRASYDIATAQAKIVAAGLPEVLANRLAAGR